MANFANEFEEYYPKLYGYFFRRVNSREDVEDLTSIVLTKLFKAMENKQIKSPKTYLWMIAHNQLVDFYRSSKTQDIRIGVEEGWEVDASIDNSRSNNYQRFCEEVVENVKKHSTEEDYKLVQMYYLEGMSSEDVAAELGMSPANVRKKASRIITKLKKLIKVYV